MEHTKGKVKIGDANLPEYAYYGIHGEKYIICDICSEYIYIVIYKDSKMQMNESDFNRINIDDILNTIENGLLIN